MALYGETLKLFAQKRAKNCMKHVSNEYVIFAIYRYVGKEKKSDRAKT